MNSLLSNLQGHIGNNNFLAYPLAFLGGVLVSFTPCVYAVIPVTIGYIGALSAGSIKKSFLLSLAYISGLSLVYSILGALASLTGFFFGRIASSGWTYFILGGIFIILGLSAVGLYSIPFIGFKKTGLTKPRSYFGSFLVGGASGLVVGPCIAPALGVILAYVAARRNVVFGISLLFTFALGMSMLYLLLGTFSSLLERIPRLGKFNVIIEKFFGGMLILGGILFLIMGYRRF